MSNSSPVSLAPEQQLLANTADEFTCHGWAWVRADGIPQSRAPADSVTRAEEALLLGGDEQEPQLLKMDAESAATRGRSFVLSWKKRAVSHPAAPLTASDSVC